MPERCSHMLAVNLFGLLLGPCLSPAPCVSYWYLHVCLYYSRLGGAVTLFFPAALPAWLLLIICQLKAGLFPRFSASLLRNLISSTQSCV